MKKFNKDNKDVNFFIMGVADKKMREYLVNVYLDGKDTEVKEIDNELFRLKNNISEKRMNKIRNSKSFKQWKKRTGK